MPDIFKLLFIIPFRSAIFELKLDLDREKNTNLCQIRYKNTGTGQKIDQEQ